MNPRRQVVLLLDIDDTLVNFHQSRHYLVFTGTQLLWIELLTKLKSAAAENNIDIHYGIATFKPIGGDDISKHILEIFRNYFDPQLIFFTDGKSKVEYALKPALEIIRARGLTIDKRDIFIFDDILNMGENTSVIVESLMEGFNAIHAADFTKSSQETQCQRIINSFEFIFRSLGISHSMPYPVQLIDEKKAAEEQIKIETQEREERELLQKMRLQREQFQKQLESAIPNNFLKQIEKLSLSHKVKSLEEDDEPSPSTTAVNTFVPT